VSYVFALALVCLSSVAPEDCTRDTAVSVSPLTSVEPITPAGCAMLTMHMMASTALPGRGKYVKIVCEERRT
jgi:hypothetical protein